MARPKKGHELGMTKTRKTARKAGTKTLDGGVRQRLSNERPLKRRVGEGLRVTRPSMVKYRESLTKLGHDLQAAVELAQRHERHQGWPKVTRKTLDEAKKRRELISRKDRVIFVDGCGRVGVGKVVAEHTCKSGSRYAVLQRMYPKSVDKCHSFYAAVPHDRIVC